MTPSFRARNKVITGITMRTTFSMNRPSDPCRHTFGQLRILQPIPICWKNDLRQMGKLMITKLPIWKAPLSHPPGRERDASLSHPLDREREASLQHPWVTTSISEYPDRALSRGFLIHPSIYIYIHMVNFQNLLATLRWEIRPFGQASDRASDTFGHCSVFSFS